jgi:molybdopterin converting factor small subunit
LDGKNLAVKLEIAFYMLNLVDNHDIVEVKGTTIRECLNELTCLYPAMREHLFDNSGNLEVIVMYRGEPVGNEQLDTRVKDGDAVSIYPVIIGG